jgi:ABC-type nitrate/sulfonate/bicarbonate transport system permease component
MEAPILDGRVVDITREPGRRGASPRRLFAAATKSLAAFDPLRLSGAALFIVLWEAASAFVSPIILPGPLSVLQRAAADFWSAPNLSYYGVADPSLAANLAYTAENVAVAAALGAALGVALGLLSARVWFVRAAMDPVMMTAGTVPILIAAPFLLIWFGVGRASAVALVAFYIVVILYVSAQRAALNLDTIYEDYALTLGARRGRMFRDILIPGTVPEILGGFRIALAGSWGLEAVSELLGSQSGIGKVLEVLAGATDPQGILATLFVLGVAAILTDAAAAALIARFAAWRFAARS